MERVSEQRSRGEDRRSKAQDEGVSFARAQPDFGDTPSSYEDLVGIALPLRERIELGPSQLFRLVGIGLSNFQSDEEEPSPLFEATPAEDAFQAGDLEKHPRNLSLKQIAFIDTQKGTTESRDLLFHT